MKKSFRNIVSYLYPILIERKKGEVNPYLEVRLESGKYVLNSELSNYSFGGLHSIFKKVFSNYEFSNRKINSVLVLGFGAGSVVSILRKDLNFKCPITAIELDDEVIKLAKKYFDPDQYHPLHIIKKDAFEFVKKTVEKYDVVVVDLFIEDYVPDKFVSKEFINYLNKILSMNGVLFFNIMANNENNVRKSKLLLSYFTNEMKEVRLEKVVVNESENWVLIHDKINITTEPTLSIKI